ncbi:hypothetical protein AQ1_00208 [alpha proteobacterium Q-1]|nr:hypothetical protein AQ1_00208 [alpha proteobacterium Q-1]
MKNLNKKFVIKFYIFLGCLLFLPHSHGVFAQSMVIPRPKPIKAEGVAAVADKHRSSASLWALGMQYCRLPTKALFSDPIIPPIPSDRSFQEQRAAYHVALSRFDKGSLAYQMALKDLARFYFGHAMLAETLAVLRDDPAPDPALLMASHILLDRPMDEARLAGWLVDGDRDACLWAAAQSALKGGPLADHLWLGAAYRRLAAYPLWLRGRLTAIFAESLVETGRVEEAADLLGAESLPSRLSEPRLSEQTNILPADQAALLMIRGRIADNQALYEEARALYLDAMAGEGSAAIEARLRLLLMVAKRQDITMPQLITALEALRYDWRGDGIEAQVMLALAAAYRQIGQSIESGLVLHDVITAFPGSLWALVAREKLSELVHALVKPKGDDAIPDEDRLAVIDFLLVSHADHEPGLIQREITRYSSHYLMAAGLPMAAARMMQAYRAAISPQEADAFAINHAHALMAAYQPEMAAAILDAANPQKPPLLAEVDPLWLEIRIAIARDEQSRAAALIAEYEAENPLGAADFYWQIRAWAKAASAYEAAMAAADPMALSPKQRRRFLVASYLAGNNLARNNLAPDDLSAGHAALYAALYGADLKAPSALASQPSRDGSSPRAEPLSHAEMLRQDLPDITALGTIIEQITEDILNQQQDFNAAEG